MEIEMLAREENLVTLDAWIDVNARYDAYHAADEPLDPREFGGGSVVTGSGPTMLATAVLR